MATRPAPSRVRRWWLIAIAGALILILSAVLLVLHGSSRATSTDGTFSVQVPSGWQTFRGTPLLDGTAVKDQLLVVVGPVSDGVQAHVVIYPRQAGFIDLGQLAQTWRADQATRQFSGPVSHFGPMTRMTVSGSAALATECRTPTITTEIITVNHANRTDLIDFSAASSQFDQLRGGSLQTLLASWRWN